MGVPEEFVHSLESDPTAGFHDQVRVSRFKLGRGCFERPGFHVVKHDDVRTSTRLGGGDVGGAVVNARRSSIWAATHV